jgi:4-nitrophenyl phosphatase/phosphoglycolate phosphatase
LFETKNGLRSVLVLSGVTSETKLLSPENIITPDFYAKINDFFAPVPSTAAEAK